MTINTDFRALCAELADALAEWRLGGGPPEDTADADLIARARAALAEGDGPAVLAESREPASVVEEPSDEELWELFDWLKDEWRSNSESEFPLSLFARAVLARWGHPTTPPAPEVGEVGELVDKLRVYSSECSPLWAGLVRRAADILTRLALQPVPVAEKPWEREGWCDGDDQCWMGDPGGGGFIPSWRLCRPEDAPRMSVALPAHAIPLPQAGEGRP